MHCSSRSISLSLRPRPAFLSSCSVPHTTLPTQHGQLLLARPWSNSGLMPAFAAPFPPHIGPVPHSDSDDIKEVAHELQVAAEHTQQAAEHTRSAISHAALVAEHALGEAATAASAAMKLPPPVDLGPEAQRHNVTEAFTPQNRDVLLFVGWGAAVAATLIVWATGMPMRKDMPYRFQVAFPAAEGLELGVPLKLKGVDVGRVTKVALGHDQVEAEVEVFLCSTKIPKRGTTFEYNRTGSLSPEPHIAVYTLPLSRLTSSQPHDTSTSQKQDGQDRQNRQDSSPHMQDWKESGADLPGPYAAVGQADSQSDPALLKAAALAVCSASTPTKSVGKAPAAVGLTLAEMAGCAMPGKVKECQEQGLLVCAGDEVQGEVGFSMDILGRCVGSLLLRAGGLERTQQAQQAQDTQHMQQHTQQSVQEQHARQAQRTQHAQQAQHMQHTQGTNLHGPAAPRPSTSLPVCTTHSTQAQPPSRKSFPQQAITQSRHAQDQGVSGEA